MHFQFTVYDALNGLFLFLQLICHRLSSFLQECQRPKRAFLISTKIWQKKEETTSMCQRPKRAFLISTDYKALDDFFAGCVSTP